MRPTEQHLCEFGGVDGGKVRWLGVEHNELEVLTVELARTHSPLSKGLGTRDLRTNAGPAHIPMWHELRVHTCNHTVVTG